MNETTKMCVLVYIMETIVNLNANYDNCNDKKVIK